MKNIEILEKTNEYIVCIKPAGVLSEDTSGGMPSLLSDGDKKPLVVHRLDRKVSGVMVFANDNKTAGKLSKEIADKTFNKEYLAVVEGDIGKGSSLEDLLFYDKTKNKTYVVNKERKGVKKASLEFIKLASGETENGTVSLVKIKLHTGRTHQIRVQFASRKHPILGDRKYGSSVKCQAALFSHKISFNLNGENHEFKALPENIYPWSLFDKALLMI